MEIEKKISDETVKMGFEILDKITKALEAMPLSVKNMKVTGRKTMKITLSFPYKNLYEVRA